MNWNNWAAFWSMGGYGLYVWGSFGVTALVIVAEMFAVSARRRSLRRSQDDMEDLVPGGPRNQAEEQPARPSRQRPEGVPNEA